ncbi:beta-ketoacyl synthase N-terminal-like domain-containing protein [Alkalihalobacillus pseudalcaliphilus]|uniref:beta-ketoacyl synthase N-terminal-like domain-containing protein n=1 Tax=Alkalihalobacillus pseudalcaliphilus TaxID=79884 RepID=UPI00064DB80E|nr:beta-ketoacyl synthase N-terminal-like domain-containing protein [Alkalihalobacillus pseudalcaliphilus]KMK76756.1 hypothetical protein AB990_07520 [Alkalihalobacillus pseudalcaliphilus]
MSKVSIQGIGCVTPWGNEINQVYQSWIQGNIETYNVADFEPSKYFKYKGIKHISKTTKMALSSTWLALQDYAGDYRAWDKERVGVFVGNSIGYLNEVYEFLDVAYEQGADFVSPKKFTNTVLNNIPGWVSIVFGIKGINLLLQNGVTSSLDAIEAASMYLNNHVIDYAIVIGADETKGPILENNIDKKFNIISESSVSFVLSREEINSNYGYLEVLDTWQDYKINEKDYFTKINKVLSGKTFEHAFYGSGNFLDTCSPSILNDYARETSNTYSVFGNTLSVSSLIKAMLALKKQGNHIVLDANQIGNKGLMAVYKGVKE